MDEPKQKPRFQPYFSLSNLLILTAGLAIGMAAMQPWRTWEPDPTEVNYDIKIVRVTEARNLTAAQDAKLLTDLATIYASNKSGFVKASPNIKLLGNTTLRAMTKSEATYELASVSPSDDDPKLDSIQINLRPYKADAAIESIVEAKLYWKPENPSFGKTMQGFSRPLSTSPGATEIVEVQLTSNRPSKNTNARYFVVVTPSLPPTFAWVASSPGAKPVLQKKK